MQDSLPAAATTGPRGRWMKVAPESNIRTLSSCAIRDSTASSYLPGNFHFHLIESSDSVNQFVPSQIIPTALETWEGFKVIAEAMMKESRDRWPMYFTKHWRHVNNFGGIDFGWFKNVFIFSNNSSVIQSIPMIRPIIAHENWRVCYSEAFRKSRHFVEAAGQENIPKI